MPELTYDPNMYQNEWIALLQRKLKTMLMKDFYLNLRSFDISRDYEQSLYIVSMTVSSATDSGSSNGFRFKVPDGQLVDIKFGGKTPLDNLGILILETAKLEFTRYFGGSYVPQLSRETVSEQETFEKLMKLNQRVMDEEMARQIIKPTIVRQNPIDTDKVKAPKCVLHKQRMEFDPAAQKFFCPEPTCNQVARPKADSDDKIVTLGNGLLQVRFIMRPSTKARVVLISDDNVALDITAHIDPSIIGDIAGDMAKNYIHDRHTRVEKIVPIDSELGLNFTEMLLMFEP